MYFGTVWTVWVPRKVLVTLFQYISHVKIKWNSLRKLKKHIYIFKRNKYPSPNALNIKYFWTLSYNHWKGGGEVLSILNFKKTVCPKHFFMRHCLSSSMNWLSRCVDTYITTLFIGRSLKKERYFDVGINKILFLVISAYFKGYLR